MITEEQKNMDSETEALLTPPYTEASKDHPLWKQVQRALCDVYDPEIPVNIYELGLIYKIDIDNKTNDVFIEMTFTSPACPVAEQMPEMIVESLAKVEGLGKVDVATVWDPQWDPSMMAETAKLQLNMYY